MTVAEETYAVNVEVAVHRDGEYLLVERAASEDHAPGTLGLVGGTVEAREGEDVLEATARREAREEVGVEIDDLHYAGSNAFVADEGTPCVNVVTLARHDAGEPRVREPAEIAAIHWLAPPAIESNADAPPWTESSIERAEERRRELGW